MASIESTVLRVGRLANRSEYFEMDVEFSWTTREREDNREYLLQGYVFEQDGSRDEFFLDIEGNLQQRPNGNPDDELGQIWGDEGVIVRPADGTIHRFSRQPFDIRKEHIHEYRGEFFGVATLVPVGVVGSIKLSSYVSFTYR